MLNDVVVALLRLEHPQEGAERENGLAMPLEYLRVERLPQDFPVQIGGRFDVGWQLWVFVVHFLIFRRFIV